jgi:hypothetical protein
MAVGRDPTICLSVQGQTHIHLRLRGQGKIETDRRLSLDANISTALAYGDPRS